MATPYHYHRGRVFYLQWLRYARNGRSVFLCPVCRRKEVAH